MADEKQGIHVIGVEASNFHRLRVAEVRIAPGGRFVRVTGKNGAGKTSLLRAIRAALGGAGEVLDHALNDEAEEAKGEIRIELTNGFTIERRFTESAPKGYLTVTGPDGGKHGQAKLSGWLGSLSFDPLAFFDLKPERQRAVLLSLGRDVTLGDQLDAIREERRAVFDERTPWISGQRRHRAVPKPEGERPTPVNASAEMERLQALQLAQREREDLERAISAAGDRVSRLAGHSVALAARIRDREEEIRRIEQAIAEERKEMEALSEEIQRVEGGRNQDAERLDAMPRVDREIEAVHARMAAVEEMNAALEPWREWDRAQVELESANAEVAKLTERIDELHATERRLIAEAGIPVPGLSFDPESGDPLLNGRPLAVASGAERIRLAVNVAQAANPDLHICLVDEANDLDLEQLGELDRLAREHGFQVWGCRVGIEGPGEIVVEDGNARSAQAPEVAAHA